MTEELTPGERELLQAVHAGRVEFMGSGYVLRSEQGIRGVTRRMEKMRRLELIDPHGVPIKAGHVMPPDERFADYHRVTLTAAGRAALGLREDGYPRLSTCRWCKAPIRLTGPDARWTSTQLAGLAPNPQCHAAPNPDDHVMPGHEPGTPVLSPPEPAPVTHPNPASSPPVVIPRIPHTPANEA